MSNVTTQLVKVVRLNEIVEEEVVVKVNNWELVCFASILPYKLVEGFSYPVKLKLVILYDYCVTAMEDDTEQAIVAQGNGYACKIIGRLIGGYLHACGFKFEDAVFESDYAYLDGKTISIDVDRVDAIFLSQ